MVIVLFKCHPKMLDVKYLLSFSLLPSAIGLNPMSRGEKKTQLEPLLTWHVW